jgi:uncharacterized Rmd1/YagE family protein
MRAKALMLGSRIDLTREQAAETAPAAVVVQTVGLDGTLILFPFGVVVAVNLSDEEEARSLVDLRNRVQDPIAAPEIESYDISIEPNRPEHVAAGRISLRARDIERMQIVSHALAKSVVLAYYERRVASVMVNVEDLATQLRTGRGSARTTRLLREIGDALLIQAKTIGRAEVGEKPDLAWDFPELDALYDRLASDLELRERDAALSRKLSLVSSTATLYLDVIQTRKSIRVEWYIVALIVIEIALGLYDRILAS